MASLLRLLTDNLPQLTNNLVAIGLAVFALVLGFFAINYLHRRRQMLHQERMATLIKGLHYAGVARDVFAKPRTDSRDHVLHGLRWVMGGAGASGTMYAYQRLQATTTDPWEALRDALIGILPAAIGLAHLFYAWLVSRRKPVEPRVSYTAARRYY